MKSESLWIACKSCGKQMSVEAKACPNCGAPRSRYKAMKWLGGGFLAIVVIAAMASPDKPSDSTAASKVGASTENVMTLPESQKDFISTINLYSERFRATANELQQSSLRDERRGAIITALDSSLTVNGWNGTLTRLETNTDGHAIISVRLSPEVEVVTWNNALSDLVDGTMIKKGTPLYANLSQITIEDTVAISGSFLASDQDGVRETSLTIRGAMTDPAFLFHFDSISKKQ
ncbi:zinc ribbon domain-containing protein [Brucella ciceri]|uniref:zinc ribbon domain-containing protein n=1 Tax=Brucella TaxID=234 RepID=UPI0013AFF6A2|nr:MULTISPECIES: zinc ribbon domain-containing protein [Brucella]MCH6206340.1 zinc ribbon domain-containing protein [Brucella ciceri]